MNDGFPPLAPGARLRWATVRPLVEHLRPRDIVELGCGGGAFAARLARLAPSYLAIEPDDTSYRLARERLSGTSGSVVHGDHTAVPPGELFDLVCAFEVLEHLPDDRGVLAEWSGLVRPGGHILVSVPAGPSRMGAWDEAVGHFRRYSAPQMRDLLGGAGFDDIEVTHYGWPIGYLLEGVRNRIARRRDSARDRSVEERTGSSGRQLQPHSRLTGWLIGVAVLPFVLLQRLSPHRGTAMVAVGRRR